VAIRIKHHGYPESIEREGLASILSVPSSRAIRIGSSAEQKNKLAKSFSASTQSDDDAGQNRGYNVEVSAVAETGASDADLVCPVVNLVASGTPLAHPVSPPSKRGLLMRRLASTYLPGGSPDIPQNPRSVVVATGGNLGGAILTLPLVAALRQRYPNTHLAVVSNTSGGRDFMKFAGIGDSFWEIKPGSPVRPGWLRGYLPDLVKLAARRPSLLVSNHNSGIEPFLAPLRIKARVGHVGEDPMGRAIPWASVFNIPVPVTSKMNWLDTYRELADRVGAEFSGPPKVKIPDSMRQWAAERLTELGLANDEHGFAVQVGVWQLQAWKEWPVAKLADACRAIWNERGLRPVLLGDIAGLPIAAELQQRLEGIPVISLVGETSVAQAAAIIANCKATIANDSGIMHLSAAVGTPTIGVYGMSNPAKTWCYELPHRFVRRNDCVPCTDQDYRILKGCAHRKCLTRLESEPVTSAVLEALDETLSAQPRAASGEL
jgi:ADP-heptose:LPS heptosyltransferase